jgi:hypothetical protein
MVMQDIKSTTEKNGPALRAILMAMRIKRYSAERIPQYDRSRATLDATGRPPSGEYSPRIAPADAMVIDFGVKNRLVALWKSLPEASIKKARNRPSTQLIEATSCMKGSIATIKAEEQR